MFQRRVMLPGGLTLLLLATCSAQLAAQSLGDLFGGGSLSVGGAEFRDFQLTFLEATSGTDPDLAMIDAVGLTNSSEVGLQFNGNGQFAVVGANALTIEFQYSVAASPLLSGNTLDLGERTFGGNGGSIFIAEDITDVAGADLGNKFVEADTVGLTTLSESIPFDPQPELLVSTILTIEGDFAGDSVALASFSQTFSQVPEPSTGWLACTCLVLPVLLRRHRKGPTAATGKSATLI